VSGWGRGIQTELRSKRHEGCIEASEKALSFPTPSVSFVILNRGTNGGQMLVTAALYALHDGFIDSWVYNDNVSTPIAT
jgi:hypothetical protein